MQERERVLMLLAGGTPDRVPWLADLDYWLTALEARGAVPPGTRRDPWALHRELGVGFYLQGYFPFSVHYDETIQVTTREEGANRRRRTLETPRGTLTETWIHLPASYTSAPEEHLVKRVEDLAALRYLYEHTSYQPDYAELERRRPLIAEDGVLLAYLPRSPFMQLVAEGAGIRTLSEIWADAPEELEETLALLEHKVDEAAALALASPAECLMIPENLSSESVGKRFFERYLRPYECKWAARIRAAGKHSFVHMDGTLRGLIREMGSVGLDVIEAVTPAPVGDVAMGELRALAGPSVVLWGGIPGSYFTALVDDREFERLVREVLEVMVSAPRYVLGVGDQVPPDGLRRRVAQVAELAERYGRY